MSAESVDFVASCEKNDHHCIPRSFLGSVHALNITRLPVDEHNAFHQIAGYRPPDFLMRKILLASLSWNDELRTIPASVYIQSLKFLTPPDWREFYAEGTILKPEEFPNGKGATLAAIHIHRHLWEEQAILAEAIGSVGILQHISSHTRGFLKEIMAFFRSPDPLQAIRTYLIEKNAGGDRKWTKPLEPKAFSTLCNYTKEATLELLTTETRTELLCALLAHQHRLNDCINNWQPSIGDNIKLLAQHGQSNMEIALRKHVLKSD